MQQSELKRYYLCESRQAAASAAQLTLAPEHEAHLCDYCYRWHAVPKHADEAQVLRFATSLVRFETILRAQPVRGY